MMKGLEVTEVNLEKLNYRFRTKKHPTILWESFM